MSVATIRLKFMLPIAIFLVIGGFLYVGLSLDPKLIPSALISSKVPEFALPGIHDGERGLKSDDLRAGEVSVVNFFASWCGPCRLEHPLLMTLQEEGVPIYGINVMDKTDEVTAWLEELGNPFTLIGADFSGRTRIDWGVYGIPETFVIDRDGRIACKHVGPISSFDLREKIRPAVEAARAGGAVVC
jgi:cytochrome c biogenesis protein CcmG/thiol:disulfide interchange protein DsbE